MSELDMLSNPATEGSDMNYVKKIGVAAIALITIILGSMVNNYFGFIQYPCIGNAKIGSIKYYDYNFREALAKYNQYCNPSPLHLIGNGFDREVCGHFVLVLRTTPFTDQDEQDLAKQRLAANF